MYHQMSADHVFLPLSCHVPRVQGIVSTGLESWSTTPESRPWFRKRLWGSTSMLRAVVSDKERWVQALSLDLDTGLDPPGHKVRAAQGRLLALLALSFGCH